MVTANKTNATEKAQAFAHRLVEFADYDACIKYFDERHVDFDRPNDMGWSVLMSVSACGRDDLVGFVVDRTTALECATTTNRTTVLHLAAMSNKPRVMQELVATAERREKLRKVIDQPNAHGDTALMMACVAKSVRAVQLLLELGANLTAVNASGLNALMCAARACNDPRPGAPSHDELTARSANIVKILLAHGADVNIVEAAGGNTALHLAVLSENTAVVEFLLASASRIDLSPKNEAGNTALDLTDHISGVASARIADLLRAKFAQCEEEAAILSAQVEQELMELAEMEAEGDSERKQTANIKAGKRKCKKNRQKTKVVESEHNSSPVGPETAENLRSYDRTDTGRAQVEDLPEVSPTSISEIARPGKDQDALDKQSSGDSDDNWQEVVPKKNRRKDFVDGKTISLPAKIAQKPQHKHAGRKTTSKKAMLGPSKSSIDLPRTKQQTSASASMSPLLPTQATWVKQAATNVKQSILSPRSQEGSDEEEAQSIASDISYDMLNTSFERTFPVAADLEIGVEKFLIASSVSDRELEPNDSLSISQVEALQEAHWQAYHYLNEKKIELTRVLEAQRVEAQFTLQQELMQMK